MTKNIEEKGALRKGLMRAAAVGTAFVMLFGVAACNNASSTETSSATSTPNPRAQQVVAEVNGVKIYRWELDRLYEKNKETQNAYLAANLGVSDFDMDNAKYKEQRLLYREDLLNMLIDDVVTTEAAKAEGYGLTDEEKAQVDQDYETWKKENIEQIQKEKYADDADGYAKAEKEWLQSLKDNNMDEDFLKQSRYDTAVREKLSAALFADIEVDDTQLKATYDAKVAEEKEAYEADPEAYSKQYATDAFTPDNPSIFYNPPGFIRVTQIFINLPEEIDTQIKDLTKKEAEMITEQNKLASEKGKEDAQVKEMQVELDDMEAQEEELYAKGYEELQPKVDEIQKKIDDGEDFGALMEEYGEDPGMVYPFNEKGYLVGEQSTQLIAGLREAALTLKNSDIGTVSEPTQSINGIHFVKLISKVEEGPVPFDQVRDFLETLAVGTPTIESLDEYAKTHQNDFEIKINKQNI